VREQRDAAVLQLAAAQQEAVGNAERLAALASVVAAVTARGLRSGEHDSLASLPGGRPPPDTTVEDAAAPSARDVTLGSSVSSVDSA